MTVEGPVVLQSSSAAMDGGFTAVADVGGAMTTAGAADDYRLIGGATVLLHVQRLGLDLPLRATGDADFGVPPFVLQQANLVDAIEALGYHKTAGNRWERPLDDRRVAAVDLRVPTYRTRARNTVRVGDVVTTEVPGLAEALQRPGIALDIEMHLTDRTQHRAVVVIPDAIGTLALKAGARTVGTRRAMRKTCGAASRWPLPKGSPRRTSTTPRCRGCSSCWPPSSAPTAPRCPP